MTITAPVREEKSTIVRFFALPRRTRASFAVLERLAPGLGARWAEHIWFTLPQPRASTVPPVDGPAGAPFAVDVEGHRVAGTAWGTGPVVYLVHGWAGRGAQLAPFVAPLLAHGYRVVAFDAPSHGDSAPGAYGPRSSTIPEFAAALEAVARLHGPAHALIGHSLGATAVAVALCDGLPAHRVAFLAPMASPISYARQFATALGFGDRTYRRLVARVERRVGAPMKHFDVPELGRAVAMPPALVVHDREDRFTPVSDGAAIAAAWPGARLRVTTGLGHHRVLRDPDVVADVVAFVATP
jgi:pimeloyl-ACP methyl ester carboxylesterase